MNLCNFQSAPMVTTFVCLASNHTHVVWWLLERASQADLGGKSAELDHLSLKKMQGFCLGRVPVYVHFSFYRALKFSFPMDVVGLLRDGRVTTELGISFLQHAIGILPKDFQTVVNSEYEGK